MRTVVLSLALALAACGGPEPPADPLGAVWPMGPPHHVVSTPSGLTVWVAAPGRGQRVRASDAVAVRFQRWTRDGRALQGNVQPSEPPLSFTVGRPRAGALPPELALLEEVVPELAPGGWARAADAGILGEVVDVQVLDVAPVRIRQTAAGAGPPLTWGGEARLHLRAWVGGADAPFVDTWRGGEPLHVTLARGNGGALEGLLRGLVGLRVGGRRVLEVPAILAYGAAGHLPEVPPESDLRLEVLRIAAR